MSSLFGCTKSYSRSQSCDDISRDKRGREGGGGKENEYLVEPKALNELEAEKSMEQESDGIGSDWPHHAIRTSPLRSDTTTTTTRTATFKPGRSLSAPQSTNSQARETHTHTLPSTTSTASAHKYNSTVRFSVLPTVSTSSPSTRLRPSQPSHSHPYPLTTSTAFPGNPNDIGLAHPRLTTASTLYSNSTAVFGPPVKFGEQAREMPSSRQPTLVRPAEVRKQDD